MNVDLQKYALKLQGLQPVAQGLNAVELLARTDLLRAVYRHHLSDLHLRLRIDHNCIPSF